MIKARSQGDSSAIHYFCVSRGQQPSINIIWRCHRANYMTYSHSLLHSIGPKRFVWKNCVNGLTVAKLIKFHGIRSYRSAGLPSFSPTVGNSVKPGLLAFTGIGYATGPLCSYPIRYFGWQRRLWIE